MGCFLGYDVGVLKGYSMKSTKLRIVKPRVYLETTVISYLTA